MNFSSFSAAIVKCQYHRNADRWPHCILSIVFRSSNDPCNTIDVSQGTTNRPNHRNVVDRDRRSGGGACLFSLYYRRSSPIIYSLSPSLRENASRSTRERERERETLLDSPRTGRRITISGLISRDRRPPDDSAIRAPPHTPIKQGV